MTNSDPLAALAGTAILQAVTDAKDLTLWNLVKVMRREIKTKLGSKSLF